MKQLTSSFKISPVAASYGQCHKTFFYVTDGKLECWSVTSIIYASKAMRRPWKCPIRAGSDLNN